VQYRPLSERRGPPFLSAQVSPRRSPNGGRGLDPTRSRTTRLPSLEPLASYATQACDALFLGRCEVATRADGAAVLRLRRDPADTTDTDDTCGPYSGLSLPVVSGVSVVSAKPESGQGRRRLPNAPRLSGAKGAECLSIKVRAASSLSNARWAA
jgi:hypothetical protein